MKQIHEKKQIAFNRIFREFDEVYHMVALKYGFSDSAFCIFYSICELGNGCLQKDICDITFISKQTIHSSIRNLEQAGYLRLESGRGRDKHIFLTKAGEALVEEKIFPVLIAENQVFQEMTKEEGNALLQLSEKYLSILRKKLKGLQIEEKGRETKEKREEDLL